MAKKETSSDKIKQLLTQLGGTEKDWKRLSKKKDDQGQWVREFENAALGKKVAVVEKADGTFALKTDFAKAAAAPDKEALYAKLPAALAQKFGGTPEEWKELRRDVSPQGIQCFAFTREGGDFNVMVADLGGGKFGMHPYSRGAGFIVVEERRAPMSEPSKKAAETKLHADTEKMLLSTPPVETDAEKNEAADEIIALVLKCKDVFSDALLRKAGKALANRFGFGIGLCDENGTHDAGTQIALSIAPLDDTSYDQHVSGYIEHLLPEGMDEDCEASFSYNGKMSLMEVAEDMMKRGFVPNAELQEYIDEVQAKPLWNDLQKLYDKVRATPPKNGNNGLKP
jgi:hypothetical protein